MTSRLIIRNGNFAVDYLPLTGDLLIEGEKIVGIVTPNTDIWPDADVIDATDKFVLPGLVDPHTHIQLDTGIYQTDDNWEIGTKVAAYGGVTTVIDFATQFPDMSFQEALQTRLNQAKTACVDYGLHMMVTTPPDPDDPEAFYDDMLYLIDQGVNSIKLFTTYRPNYYLDDDALLQILYNLEEGMIVMVHCENDAIVTAATDRLVKAGQTSLAFHGQSRPPEAEYEAACRVVELARLASTGYPYIVHCSWSNTVRRLMQFREDQVPLYIETCPQYFTMSSDSYEMSPNPEHFIMQPALRDPMSVDEMLMLLPTVDVIATDHCDYNLSKKQAVNDFTKIPGGIPGLETSLQLTFSAYQASFKNIFSPMSSLMQELAGSGIPQLSQQESHRVAIGLVIRQMSQRPAEIFGIYPQKGSLLPGTDADVVIYDPKPKKAIKASRLHHIGGYNPYHDIDVRGRVDVTILRGKVIMEKGKFKGEAGYGQFVKGTLDTL